MRALICTPGTTLVMSGLLVASGAITLRSVCGVNAPMGSPTIELFCGVVLGLVVVRSVLSTQVASTRRSPKRSRMRSQRVFCAAVAAPPTASTREQSEMFIRMEGSPWLTSGASCPR